MKKNRVTIILTEEFHNIVRETQAKIIKETKKNFSYSKTVSLILEFSIKEHDFKKNVDKTIDIIRSEINEN